MANQDDPQQQQLRRELRTLLGQHDVAAVRAMLQQHPQLASLPDSWRHLPIQDAIGVDNQPLEMIDLLLEATPQNLLSHLADDDMGNLLRIAVRQKSAAILDRLLQVAPHLAAVCDRFGKGALHDAVMYKQLPILRSLLRACPEAATTHDGGNQGPPLIYAIYRQEYEMAMLILDAAPGCALIAQKERGRLPLHVALSEYSPNVQLVSALLQTAPSAATVADTSGMLPLHVVLSKYSPNAQLVSALLQTAPSAATVADTSGMLPLHVACQHQQQIVECLDLLVRAAPEAAKVADGKGDLPLHHAVRSYRGNVDVLQPLLDAHPGAVQVANAEGVYPIADAIHTDVAAKLVELAPHTLLQPSTTGALPLHAAAERKDADLVLLLLNAGPEACMTADHDGRLPLHVAAEKGDLKCATALLAAGPRAISTADNSGRLPLHCLCSARIFNHDASEAGNMATLLSQAYPEACTMVDSDGMLPIHRAVRAKAAILKAVLRSAPEAALVASATNGKLPLHLAAEARDEEAVELLLEAQPAAAAVADAAGLTPLDVALDVRADADLLAILLRVLPAEALANSHRRRLERKPSSEFLPTPFDNVEHGTGAYALTRVEGMITSLSRLIREKARWREKMENPDIVAKWREELLAQMAQDAPPAGPTSQATNIKILDYVFKELHVYKGLYDQATGIEMSTVDGVYQSDQLMPEELRHRLQEEVAGLKASQSYQDWHPGSNQQVLDLVHPSLYALVFGVSRAVEEPAGCLADWKKMIGGGQVEQTAAHGRLQSHKSQWLPAEISVSEDGQDAEFVSYINNLHPEQHAALYPVLAQVFVCFLPLFSKVLGYLQHPPLPRIRCDGDWWREQNEKSEGEAANGAGGGVGDPEQEEEEEEEDGERKPRRTFIPAKIPTEPQFKLLSYEYDLKGQQLQVIVKLAEIILTPEKPKYPGGVWHVEGMENECIVASGIYYYDSHNLTESRLQFREMVAEPLYQTNDHEGVKRMYGLEDGKASNQDRGSVITQSGRALAFPNMYQHKVAPFELADATVGGHRKILVFFLVDPAVYIRSTASVPPQQKAWFRDVLHATPPFNSHLPLELVDEIVAKLDWPMSREQAEAHREALMAERKYFIEENTHKWFERPFSLCEH